MRQLVLIAVLLVWASANSQAQELRSFEVFIPYSSSPLMGGTERPTQRAVTSQREWRALWAEIQGRIEEELVLPEVDWERTTILVLGLGSRPTGGYAIVFGSVREFETEIQVEAYELVPGTDCVMTTGLTYPISYARIMRTDKAVRFRVDKATVSCPS